MLSESEFDACRCCCEPSQPNKLISRPRGPGARMCLKVRAATKLPFLTPNIAVSRPHILLSSPRLGWLVLRRLAPAALRRKACLFDKSTWLGMRSRRLKDICWPLLSSDAAATEPPSNVSQTIWQSTAD